MFNPKNGTVEVKKEIYKCKEDIWNKEVLP